MAELDELFVSEQLNEFEIEHKGKTYKFKIKELPWLKVNKIMSKAAKVTTKGVEISLDAWYEEYLSKALVEAPWPISETRLALRKLGSTFGSKLEKHVPRPGGFIEDIDFFGQE